jgi:hypothetical protein
VYGQRLDCKKAARYIMRLILVFALMLSVFGGERNVIDGSIDQMRFLGATPTSKSPRAFASALYKVDKNAKTLVNMQQLTNDQEGVEFVRVTERVAVVGTPHTFSTHAIIADLRGGNKTEIVELPNDRGFITANVLSRSEDGSFIDLLQYSLASKTGIPRTSLVGVNITPDSKGRRLLLDTSWSAMQEALIPGDIVGPFSEWDGIYGVDTPEGITYSPGVTNVRLTPPLAGRIAKQARRYVLVLSANPSYLVIAPELTPGELAKRTDTSLEICDRKAASWKPPIRIVGNAPRVRLFGEWLAITEFETRDADQTAPSTAKPKHFVDQFYASASPSLDGHGHVLLVNLFDGRRIDFTTGDRDSEILGIRGDRVCYRTYEKLWLGPLGPDIFIAKRLIADDDAAWQIHWMFW